MSGIGSVGFSSDKGSLVERKDRLPYIIQMFLDSQSKSKLYSDRTRDPYDEQQQFKKWQAGVILKFTEHVKAQKEPNISLFNELWEIGGRSRHEHARAMGIEDRCNQFGIPRKENLFTPGESPAYRKYANELESRVNQILSSLSSSNERKWSELDSYPGFAVTCSYSQIDERVIKLVNYLIFQKWGENNYSSLKNIISSMVPIAEDQTFLHQESSRIDLLFRLARGNLKLFQINSGHWGDWSLAVNGTTGSVSLSQFVILTGTRSVFSKEVKFFTFCHSYPSDFPVLKTIISNVFNEALKLSLESKESSDALKEKVGLLRYLLSHAAFSVRGSAAIAECFERTLLPWDKAIMDERECDGLVDLEALIYPLSTFMKRYMEQIRATS